MEKTMKKAIAASYPFNGALLSISIAVLFALLSSCTTVETQQEPLLPLYFPAPPEAPRFVFERSVMGSADLMTEKHDARLRRLLTGESSTTMAFSKPFDVTSCQGTMFVSDTVKRIVFAFNAPHKEFFLVGTSDPGMLAKPLGLATDEECRLYVADASRAAILIYQQDGTFIKSIGGKEYFDRLSHVAVNADGSRVFAVDTGGVESQNHRVRVFDTASGNHLYDIGTRGSEPGQFNLPRDIAITADGLLYVVDGGNFRVQVLTQEGEFKSEFGALGQQMGEFARPKGIAVDAEDNSYVSDASHGNFQIFNEHGELLLFVGTRSEQNQRARYMLPAGLHVDEDGRVYMVDQYFRKVDIYRPAALAENQGYLGSWASGAEQ